MATVNVANASKMLDELAAILVEFEDEINRLNPNNEGDLGRIVHLYNVFMIPRHNWHANHTGFAGYKIPEIKKAKTLEEIKANAELAVHKKYLKDSKVIRNKLK
jgi:transcriptional regulatory protein LevR